MRISASAPVSVYRRERRAISSIQSAGKRGGSRFMKKSFRAVATAFTGMSSSEMLMSGSAEKKEKVSKLN